MNRWVGTWLRAWRTVPLAFVSPLSAEAARARLAEGSISSLRAVFSFGGGGGGFTVAGHVGARRISVQAARAGVRNSWRPVFRGRLEPAEPGCRLAGRVGWSPVVRAFSAVWFGGACATFLGVVAVSLRGGLTGKEVLACLVPLVFPLFFVAVTAWGIRAGRPEEAYLRSWLAERLRTAEAGIPGYRPWSANDSR